MPTFSPPELALRAVAALALGHFTDDELCAFNNAKATEMRSVDELVADGMVGVYVTGIRRIGQ